MPPNNKQLRAQIVKLHKQDVGIREISRRLSVSRETVRRWIRRYKSVGTLVDLRQNNHRPSIISEEERRIMQTQYILNGYTPTSQFAEMFDVHPRTIRNCLRNMGFHHRWPPKNVALTKAQKTARLDFAHQYLNFDWTSTVFIDEMTFSGSQSGRLHLWQFDRTRLTEEELVIDDSSHPITANILGWICSAGVGELVNLTPAATALEYVNLLEESVLPTLRIYFPKQEFPVINIVQHNTIHKSKIVQKWFNNNEGHLKCIPWPAQSADLNPIEDIWGAIVQRWSSQNETTKEALSDHCHKIWEDFRGTEICQQLIGSMKKRLSTVIQNNGGYACLPT